MAVGGPATATADVGVREGERVVQVTPGVIQIYEDWSLGWTANTGLLVGGRSRAADSCKQGRDPLGGPLIASCHAEGHEVGLEGYHSGPSDGPGTFPFGRDLGALQRWNDLHRQPARLGQCGREVGVPAPPRRARAQPQPQCRHDCREQDQANQPPNPR